MCCCRARHYLKCCPATTAIQCVQAAGQPATAVQWGAWGGAGGMAARTPGFVGRMERQGLGLLAPEAGLAVLAAVLGGAAGPAAGQLPQAVTIGELEMAPALPPPIRTLWTPLKTQPSRGWTPLAALD